MRLGPRALHLRRRAIGLAAATHPFDDPLREEHPDLVVVVELGMPLDFGERRAACVVVAVGVERQPMPLTEAAVALRPEHGPWLGDRVVDVEDNGTERHDGDDSLRGWP